MEKSQRSTPLNVKYLSNVHKIGGAHLQCKSNHYAKFEYEGMKNCCSYRLHKQTPLLFSDGKVSKSNTRKDKK